MKGTLVNSMVWCSVQYDVEMGMLMTSLLELHQVDDMMIPGPRCQTPASTIQG